MNIRAIIVMATTSLVSTALPLPGGEPAPISPTRACQSIKDVALGNYTMIVKLHVLPSFHTPVYVEEYYGPADPKILAFRVDATKVEIHWELRLSEQNKSTAAKLSNLPGFLALSEKEQANKYSVGLDGDTYILEIKDKNGYHRVERWAPDSFSKERGLEYFYSLCKDILDRAGILPRPSNLSE